jgi:hypothetical protein
VVEMKGVAAGPVHGADPNGDRACVDRTLEPCPMGHHWDWVLRRETFLLKLP